MLHIWDCGVTFLLREAHFLGKTQLLSHPRLFFSTFFTIYRDFFLHISLAFLLFILQTKYEVNWIIIM